MQSAPLSQLVNQLPGFAQGVSDQLSAMTGVVGTTVGSVTKPNQSTGTWKTRSAALNATALSAVYNSHLGDFGWLVPEKYVVLDAGYISAPAPAPSVGDDVGVGATPNGLTAPNGPYDYVIIGTPNRNNLWLLTRSATALTAPLQQQYLKVAQANNWPAASLQRLYTVPQTAIAAAASGSMMTAPPLPSFSSSSSSGMPAMMQFEPSVYGQDMVPLS
jgi:hypothetical protein